MSRHSPFLILRCAATALALAGSLAACKGKGPQNWSGDANTLYTPRTVYSAPVVWTNVPRVGRQMADQQIRSILEPTNVPGLRAHELLSSVASPSRSGGQGVAIVQRSMPTPQITVPAGRMRQPIGGVPSTVAPRSASVSRAGAALPNIGRRIR